MKKSSNHGFVLAETLIVSTIVMAALVFVYTQFRTINQSYNRTFKYNTVEGMYAADNIKKYLTGDGFGVLKLLLDNGNSQYVDVTSCPSVYIMNSDYCSKLMHSLKIEQVFITKNDIDSVRSFMQKEKKFSEEMKLFSNHVSDLYQENYRLWIEFEDKTFATLVFE